MGDASGTEVGLSKRACDQVRGSKQARRRRRSATGRLGLPRLLPIRDDRLRTAKMRSGLVEKIGEARDPRPGADDVQEIAMLACGPIGLMWNST
ncbi:hypothetical protein SDC9_39084 [bioreactor metagenome]|uniref:Uncharacterized protein n=1 Tax=bioreactor metagenome TaxID=1076179 RepID=A0A644VP39_9ZZZZ